MSTKKFLIAFDTIVGGFGDRIVGLFSIKLISKLLNGNFYIIWSKENIRKYLNYSKYDYELLNGDTNNIKEYYCIDNINKIDEYLINTEKLFENDINVFRCNLEISQYLYKNHLFHNHNFTSDILNEYQTLYTDILIPTDYLKNKIDHLIQNKENIVGLQIRCGDSFIKTNKGENYDILNISNVINQLSKIKSICDLKFNNYNIFLTTDNDNIYNEIISIFDKSIVIYNHDLVQHLDRKEINSDISKTFVDNYILSQKTKMLFISTHSNYGRIAALSCPHNNIYSFETFENSSSIIDKICLVSKCFPIKYKDVEQTHNKISKSLI